MTSLTESDLQQQLAKLGELRTAIGQAIVGQQDVVEQLLIGLLAGGHCLLEGVPGLGKTLLVRSLGQALHLQFRRVQFTPDLMPSDILGTELLEEDHGTGHRHFRFQPGPIFTHLLLADELNRTPPKTQAALLEAMQEHQVTVGGTRHLLPEPFFVLATQNPIEQEGTYPLPEAQLDRFMFQIHISYPTESEEIEIVRRSSEKSHSHIVPVLDAAGIAKVQEIVRRTPVADHVIRYALRLVRATRIKEPMDGNAQRPKLVQDYVGWGAGPRASEYLIQAAKAKAVLTGATHVTPDHVRSVAKPVLRHRLLLNFNAEADQVTSDAVVEGLLAGVSVESASADEKQQMERVLR